MYLEKYLTQLIALSSFLTLGNVLASIVNSSVKLFPSYILITSGVSLIASIILLFRMSTFLKR